MNVILDSYLCVMFVTKNKNVYQMRGSNSRPLACEASVIATTPI